MAILVMGIMLTFVEVVAECCMMIAKKIVDIAEHIMFKYRLRKRRGGNYIKRNYKYKKSYSVKL